MKKIRIDDCIFHSKIKNHLKIKNDILFEIDKCPINSLHLESSYYSDSISKLDWYKNSDFNRPWVKIFLPEFCKDVEEIIFSMCYNRINLMELWFQQYLEGDTHGWHIHGDHFTGVYYLEFPEGCSQTEIVSPYNLTIKKIDVVDVTTRQLEHIIPQMCFQAQGVLDLGKPKKTISNPGWVPSQIRYNFEK